MTLFTMPNTRSVAFECDDCGTSLDTEKRDFGSARDVLKAEGWATQPAPGGKWRHLCDDCKD